MTPVKVAIDDWVRSKLESERTLPDAPVVLTISTPEIPPDGIAFSRSILLRFWRTLNSSAIGGLVVDDPSSQFTDTLSVLKEYTPATSGKLVESVALSQPERNSIKHDNIVSNRNKLFPVNCFVISRVLYRSKIRIDA